MNPSAKIYTADLRATLLTWGPIVAGLGFMYGPSFVDLFRGIWSTDEQAHGPIVLGVSCWLVWRNWPAMWARSTGAQTSAAGWPVVVVGLLLYIVGRSQEILLFEVGSLIWLLTGILLLMRGAAAVKAQWFALFFMLFMIPLPGVIVDAVTMPMKMAVSYAAENILSALLLIIGVDSLLQAGVRFRREIKPQENSPPVAHDHTLLTRSLNPGTLASA